MALFASALAISAAAAAGGVASLDLCADEYLLLLAKRGEIASVSRLAHDPLDSPLWRRARGIRANDGSVGGVIAMRPRLLLAVGGGRRSTEALARRLGMAVLALPYPASIADVETNMARVAAALGEPGRTRPWRERLERLRQAPRGAVDAIWLTGGGLSLAPGSLGAEWMRLAGYRQRALAGGRASLEQLAIRPPRVLLLSDYRHQQESLGQRWLGHPLLRKAATRTILTDGRPWTCAGPLMPFEIERLRGKR